MKQKRIRYFFICALSAIVLCAGTLPIYAYYDLPPVGITLGQIYLTLNSGESRTVSVNVSPASEQQLPGCGMAECPQECGEGCLDGNGWCTCAGMNYQDYPTVVSISGYNNSVISANYGGGVISIQGVSPGTTAITITADLAKHRTASASLQVTVNKSAPVNPGTGSNTGNNNTNTNNTNNTNAGNNSANTETPSATPVTNTSTTTNNGNPQSPSAQTVPVGNTTTEPAKDTLIAEANVPAAPAPTGIVSMNGRNGIKYTIADLSYADISVGALFAAIAGNSEVLSFQQKDAAGNVQYSLSFIGTALTSAPDLNLAAALTEELPQEVSVKGDALMLHFDEHEPLPAAAEVYVAAGTHFADASIDVYQLDPITGLAEKIATNGRVVSGYVVFDIASTNDVVLVSGDIVTKKSGFPVIPVSIGGGLVIIGAVLSVLRIRRVRAKRRYNLDLDGDWAAGTIGGAVGGTVDGMTEDRISNAKQDGNLYD